MTAGDRRRFEARLRHRLDEEYFIVTSLSWESAGVGLDYAMIRLERQGKVLGLALSARMIDESRDPRVLIDHLARQVARDYQQAKEQ